MRTPPDAERMTPAEQALMMAAVTFGDALVAPRSTTATVRLAHALGVLERAAVALGEERSR